jgi:hypothetical protein
MKKWSQIPPLTLSGREVFDKRFFFTRTIERIMTDTDFSITCEDPSSCQGPLLLALLDGQKSLLEKVDAVLQLSGKMANDLQTLKNKVPKSNNSTKATICRLHVNRLVFALQVEHPEKDWTSEDFAKEIGCTASAVRQTKNWKAYQERQQYQKEERKQKGFKDENGNFDVWDSGNGKNLEDKN